MAHFTDFVGSSFETKHSESIVAINQKIPPGVRWTVGLTTTVKQELSKGKDLEFQLPAPGNAGDVTSINFTLGEASGHQINPQ